MSPSISPSPSIVNSQISCHPDNDDPTEESDNGYKKRIHEQYIAAYEQIDALYSREFQQRIAPLAEERNSLVLDLESLRAEHSDLKVQKQNIEEEMSLEIQSLKAQLSVLRSDTTLDTLKSEISVLRTRFDEVKEDRDKYRCLTETHQDNLDRLNLALSNTRAECRRLEASVQSANSTINAMQEEIAQKPPERQLVDKSVDTGHGISDCEEASNELDGMKKCVEELSAENCLLKSKIDVQKLQLIHSEGWEEEKRVLEGCSQELRRQLDMANRRIAELELAGTLFPAVSESRVDEPPKRLPKIILKLPPPQPGPESDVEMSPLVTPTRKRKRADESSDEMAADCSPNSTRNSEVGSAEPPSEQTLSVNSPEATVLAIPQTPPTKLPDSRFLSPKTDDSSIELTPGRSPSQRSRRFRGVANAVPRKMKGMERA